MLLIKTRPVVNDRSLLDKPSSVVIDSSFDVETVGKVVSMVWTSVADSIVVKSPTV